MAEPTGQRLSAGLDPRQRIQRNRFNEYFVFLLSSVGATIVVPVVLLIAFAIGGDPGLPIFLGATVVLELVLIFGIGRPAMKPNEATGWALLWGTTAALLGLCFYYLVIDNVV